MRMNNRQIKYVDGPLEDLYIYYLEGRAAQDTDTEVPDFIGNWEEDGYSFLFYSRPCAERIDEILIAQPQLTLIDSYHMTYAEWLGESPATLSAGRFIIVPPWEKGQEEAGPNGDSLRIVLDPGIVFGTGTHVTTRDCLRAIERVYESDSPPRSAIDLGTGTGVLAIAAAAMGCHKTLAVDINLLAARTTSKNVCLNQMENLILAVQGKAEIFIDTPVELLLANIHFDIMRLILTSAGFRQKKWFVLSGLMRSQAKAVVELLAESGAEVLNRWESDGIWHTFLGTNPGVRP